MCMNTSREGAERTEPGSFSVVPSARIRSNGRKLKYRRFCLNIRKHFFTVQATEHCHRLAREVVEFRSLKIFKRHLDMAMSSLV